MACIHHHHQMPLHQCVGSRSSVQPAWPVRACGPRAVHHQLRRLHQPVRCIQERHPQHQQQQQHHQSTSNSRGRTATALLATVGAAAAMLCASTSGALAATAESNYGTKCLGCHVAGGNIIQAGATLFQEDLVKNGVADAEGLYKLIYSGKGRMPGFGTECAPKAQCTFGARLSDEEVQDLVAYVQDNAAAGWKQQ